MFYDYLFYNSYLLAKKSKNFDDEPILGGVFCVFPCLIINSFTVLMFLEAKQVIPESWGEVDIHFLLGLFLVIATYYYYKYDGRWKKVVQKYEAKEKEKGRLIPPIAIFILYYVGSLLALQVVGQYKNGDWLFG